MAWLVGGLLGLALGSLGGFWLSTWLRRGRRSAARHSAAPARTPVRTTGVTEDLPLAILGSVPIGVAVIGPSDDVLLDNEAGRQMGIAVAGKLPPSQLVELARRVRREGPDATLQKEMTLPSFGWRSQPLEVRVRAIALADGMVALLVEDFTESRRVEAVRRDFVANVGHEIKTPVGALALLLEAAFETADDDREQMFRFLSRARHETARLSKLVSELIDLSRVQGAEARPDPAPVSLDAVLAEAVDRVSSVADAKDIVIVVGGDVGGKVLGSESQLVTALANLLENAITYSEENTRVALAARQREESWEITVTDQGIGIPAEDLDRVFERFYRVDPARSRETGGTGLGLAIVKNIVNNHGGHVRVWSSPGSGSTFTLELPA
ncbi:MAG: histidine kinase, partial [Mycobacterium sp.]|nr:histidine kinase [Mycobacterium sp.]